MKKTFKSRSSADTFNFGLAWGKELSGGEIILLSGILGVGKTVFARGVAKALKVKNKITSPTFNIFRVYDCQLSGKKKGKLYHFDCYRLRKYQELVNLGFEEIIKDKNSVVLLEWPERFLKKHWEKNFLPRRVNISLDKEGTRTIKVK